MADTEYKRLIQASREKAVEGFAVLAERTIQDAEHAAAEQLRAARTVGERAMLAAARHLLREDRARLLRRGQTLYQGCLERAFHTMYVDLRADMRRLSADQLTLIDDEVINYQIEIGRLAERMREANEEAIGRLNVIIAGLHGAAEARERENPFRPYLLARALYETSREAAGNDAHARTLFALLSSAVLAHLPAYYQSIRDVFVAHGVQGKFALRRSHNAELPRYHPGAGDAALARLLPRLQTMMERLQLAPVNGSAGTPDMQDVLRRMFGTPQQPEQLGPEKSPLPERMTTEVMTMLFDLIRQDDAIPAMQRQLLAGLQVPLLKAAVLEPDLLRDAGHPARRLLNRLGSATLDAGPGDAAGAETSGTLHAGIARAVARVRDEYETDSEVFARCLQEFDRFVAAQPGQPGAPDRCIADAAVAAEKSGILLTCTIDKLRPVLLRLNPDRRIADFIVQRWALVLVRASREDAGAGRDPACPHSLFRPCHDVIAELLWSVQNKPTPPERSTLVGMLPDLVRRLRAGLALIRLPENEVNSVLDLLMAMHTQVLRGADPTGGAPQPTLDALRAEFLAITVAGDQVSWDGQEPPPAHAGLVEQELAQCGIAVDLRLGPAVTAGSVTDSVDQAWSWAPGARVEFLLPDRQCRPGRVAWVSPHRSLHLLREDGSGKLVLYDHAALNRAVRERSLLPLEHAPVFERAVASLLLGAARLTQAA